jgi:hypothetical protein
MKNLLKNINVLNLILLAAAAGLFFALVYPLLDSGDWFNAPRLKEIIKKGDNAAVENIREYLSVSPDQLTRPFVLFGQQPAGLPKDMDLFPREKIAAAGNAPTGMDYIIVTEKNLFHPERKMPSDKKEEPQIARPEVIYYGSIITSEKRIAYIEDRKNPYSTPGRGKRQTPVAQGAMIGGYKLTRVNPENIVLERGDDKMVVNLRDEKDRKAAEMTGTSRPVQTAGAGKSSAATPRPQMPAAVQVPASRPSGPVYPDARSTGPSMPQRPSR